jgi:hypothetical protein
MIVDHVSEVRTASIIRDESVDNHFTRQYNPEDSSERDTVFLLYIPYNTRRVASGMRSAIEISDGSQNFFHKTDLNSVRVLRHTAVFTVGSQSLICHQFSWQVCVLESGGLTPEWFSSRCELRAYDCNTRCSACSYETDTKQLFPN